VLTQPRHYPESSGLSNLQGAGCGNSRSMLVGEKSDYTNNRVLNVFACSRPPRSKSAVPAMLVTVAHYHNHIGLGGVDVRWL
jgi:hypothetical protein